MENEKSIYQLIKELEMTGKEFLVPSYQRGYRWQKVNVSDLLNDLYEFLHNDKSVYSLQPLVVFSADDNSYHVVDGQQRLTTISILLGYLGLKQLEIKYESRRDQQINKFSSEHHNIDQYHVNQAYLTIKDWFEVRHPEEKMSFIELLQDNDKKGKKVKFIWYCTEDNEVATFIRLNKNKISLTNAELIKALLLKQGNFERDSILMQKNIAVEWNKIENTFNDDAFWCFIRPIEDCRSTRIDYLFELVKNKNLLDYIPNEECGNDNYTTFRYFYSYFKEYKESAFEQIWMRVNRIYDILLHWYNEVEVYHYIGYLVIFNPKCIGIFLDKWMEPGMTIDMFKNHLKCEIDKIIRKSGCNNLSRQYKYNEERNPDKKAAITILLLFNIQRIILLNRNMSKKSDTQLFNKFPFYLYKDEVWNVEHIASNTDNDLSKPEEQKEWLKTFLLDTSISENNRKDIVNFINGGSTIKPFETIRKELDELQQKELKKEEHLNDKEKNQIWNFCLLDEHTNKSYGNSIFPVKRRIIMGKEMGKKYVLDNNLNTIIVPNVIAFVPACTKDTFVKAYTTNATSPREWSLTDATAYRKEMYDCLKSEFNVSLDK